MSHIVTIKTQVRDSAAIELACHRLQLPVPIFGTAMLFSVTATGWQVQLPDLRLSGRLRCRPIANAFRQLWRPLGRATKHGPVSSDLRRGTGQIGSAQTRSYDYRATAH